ncbi:MAG TPA: hypothetical protein DDW94_10910 [Deltaproteobacteria bacterium]|nr:MAG: hypothetical protein A2Z79_11470 [Deltaproteobacteria bacterium GWA2_55_82]OGQ63489.1 MAG: hypothetical protein A3I81_05655 [Deltaproteobacteria bacterium RIFCSPLOWO2_02_FULL_55_12]OIJ74869.1 MAG: hypothetical protein A2V21_311710 [Deltaproteobacteria bacterium GWC2_55_46]HBG47479.1 hypothetical protein [Deltaproteobacteria bacterium]HCY11495.1 hypothetical protein [Deltaproteobacteria bacterium]
MKGARRFKLALVAVAAVIFLLVYHRAVFDLPARALFVDTGPGTGNDAIVCLSGAETERVEHCLELYRKGLAGVVVVTGGGLEKGLVFYREGRSLASISRDWLSSHGVPEGSITTIEEGTSTYEEALAVREFAVAKGLKSIVVVSSPYHMRRVSLVFRNVFGGSGVSLGFSPARPFDEGLSGWWKEEGLVANVCLEYMKLIVYAAKGYLF